jgi:hypothetical protein
MAEAIEIGNLVIRLIADAKQLEAGLKQATAATKKYGDDASKNLKGADDVVKRHSREVDRAVSIIGSRLVALAGTFASVATAMQAFNRGMANIASLDQLSQQTGIAVERLDALRFAAAQVGVDFNVIEQSVRGFSQRLAEGLGNSTSAVTLALRSMNVQVRESDGSLRNFADILPDLADRFSQYQDGVAKAQLATALFGEEAGPKLVPLLNRGRAGLQDLMEKAKEYGLVTSEQVQTQRNYREAISRVQQSVDQLAIEFATRLAPAVTVVADAITRLIRQLPSMSQTQQGTEESVRRATEALEGNAKAIAAVEAVIARMSPRARQDDINRLERLKAQRGELESIIAAESALLAMRNSGYKPPEPPKPPDVAALREGAQESIKEAQFQLQQLTERLTGVRPILDELNFQWLSHAEKIQQATELINRAYDKSGDRRRALAVLNQQFARADMQAALQVSSTLAQAIQAIWPKQKGAAIASAVINTAVGITRALSELPPPWSYAQAALVGAMGAAQVAQIRSMNSDGSGAGQATAPVAAAPAAAPAAPEQASRSLFIQGVDPGAMFSGRQVEELIRSINTEVQNGATLISTRNVTR